MWTNILVLTEMSSPQIMIRTPEIPYEVKKAVKALDNPVRWKIIETLRAKQDLSYTQLLESLDVRKGQLTYHLNMLLKGSIIQNYSKDILETPYDSFYAITHFGCLLYTSPSPRDLSTSRMPSSA